MARLAIRTHLDRFVGVAATGIAISAAVTTPTVHADSVAYLVNVTVRPGYDFAGPDAALRYGYGICGKIGAGDSYAHLVDDVQTDFATPDPYQASYLIAQAVNELCPALIWQLRNSAANYRPQ